MDLKQQVLAVINIEREANELLGNKTRSGNYHCYNKDAHSQGDANASLSLNHENGLYICHACGVKGDIFSLIMDCRGMDRSKEFGTLLKQLAAKYGIMASSVKIRKERKIIKQDFSGFKILGDKHIKDWVYSTSKVTTQLKMKLIENYGISPKTIEDYKLGWHGRRLWIPIPAQRFDFKSPKSKLINVRKHDVLRKCCKFVDDEGNIYNSPAKDTKPFWGERGGKVIGVRNHNVAYVYPMATLLDSHEVWLVGGELKALLLNQFNVPAVCFTSGEGRYHKELLKFFVNKTVRVVMDIDDAGERATFGDEKRHGLAQVIADNGAKKVYGGRIPSDGLPKNGDITDFLRINGWDISCLEHVQWEEFKPSPVMKAGWPGEVDHEIKVKDFSEVEYSKFDSLLDPRNSGKTIKVPFVVSGRGTTPYLLPCSVYATCEAGQMDARPICPMCPMTRNNFEMKAVLTDDERIDLVGQTPAKVRAKVAGKLRLPKCHYPDINIETDSIERLIVIPTLDSKHSGDQFNYRQHAIYSLGSEYLTENVSYEGVGRVLPEPKNSQYTWALAKHRSLDNDIFNYTFNEKKSSELRDALVSEDIVSTTNRLISSLRDNYLHKYGADRMILFEMLAFFMPFEFSLGKYKNYKVCPEVCILGEPRSGKSSTAKDLLSLFGAGRYVDAPTVTTIGLIGGNSSYGSANVFTWGAIPMCHRAVCIVDECNKLSIETIETLTNLRSSGIAERTTVSGIRKIRSNVRFLWLCNPRGGRSLQHYSSPVKAAQEVFGSPQDLARLDLLHIQKAQRNARIVNQFHESTTESFYTKEMARYHLQWAWSLKEEDVVFEDPLHIMDRAVTLVEKYRTPLLPTAETKFKVARIAAGISALCYSIDRYNKCFVSNDAVDFAFEILDSYSSINVKAVSSSGPNVPQELSSILGSVPPTERTRLRAFIVQDMMTMSEMKELFGANWTVRFLQTAFYEMGLIKRRRAYFMWEQELRDYIGQFINERQTTDRTNEEDSDEEDWRGTIQ